MQPQDDDARDGVTNTWVRSNNAGDACYYSIWGNGQPCADLASPQWREELARILHHWVVDFHLDGFMFDAPPFYLAAKSDTGDNPISGVNDDVIAEAIWNGIRKPLQQLGAAAFGETYNLLTPAINKMLDGGRNTDMADGFPGFPGRLHKLIMSRNASRLEALLKSTIDILGGWPGGAVRTEPDSRGNVSIAAQKAAVTALVGSYYVVRMGTPNCTSPLPSYGPSPPGDEWPGGCFGKWVAADAVAATLKAVRNHSSLRPGTRRVPLLVQSGGDGIYAALRSDGGNKAVVILFNFEDRPIFASIDISTTDIVVPQETFDIISAGSLRPVAHQ